MIGTPRFQQGLEAHSFVNTVNEMAEAKVRLNDINLLVFTSSLQGDVKVVFIKCFLYIISFYQFYLTYITGEIEFI